MKKDAILFCTIVLNLALGRQAKANRKAIHYAIKTAFSREVYSLVMHDWTHKHGIIYFVCMCTVTCHYYITYFLAYLLRSPSLRHLQHDRPTL